MRIQFASDLHLDYSNRTWPRRQVFRAVPDRDVLVLAGDIGRGLMARAFVEEQLEISAVVYVPGNHEYYGRHVARTDVDLRWLELADAHRNLLYLVGETAEVDGIKFWGGPWYSDLWGAGTAVLWLVSRPASTISSGPSTSGGRSAITSRRTPSRPGGYAPGHTRWMSW